MHLPSTLCLMIHWWIRCSICKPHFQHIPRWSRRRHKRLWRKHLRCLCSNTISHDPCSIIVTRTRIVLRIDRLDQITRGCIHVHGWFYKRNDRFCCVLYICLGSIWLYFIETFMSSAPPVPPWLSVVGVGGCCCCGVCCMWPRRRVFIVTEEVERMRPKLWSSVWTTESVTEKSIKSASGMDLCQYVGEDFGGALIGWQCWCWWVVPGRYWEWLMPLSTVDGRRATNMVGRLRRPTTKT